MARAKNEPACWSWRTPKGHPDVEFGPYFWFTEWQDCRCAVCGHRRKDRDLVDDHDHETGLIRGLLCRRCNALEGYAWEGNNLFDNYRLKPPIDILQLRPIPYRDSWGRVAAEPEPPWALHDNPPIAGCTKGACPWRPCDNAPEWAPTGRPPRLNWPPPSGKPSVSA